MNESTEVYTFGQNNYGELALGHTEEQSTPSLVQACINLNVIQVAAGNELTLVLLDNGNVFCSGYHDIGVSNYHNTQLNNLQNNKIG